jgi:hypothetical protein
MGSPGNDQCAVSIPKAFCWTKFGDEAGESIGSIFGRKEVERRRNGGVFLWGIGQSIRPSLLQLLRLDPAPSVIFSPMRSAPARRDISPSSIVVWYEGVGLDGHPYYLPEHSLVTSRRDERSPRDFHFALVCESSSPIDPCEDAPSIQLSRLRNLVTGSAVGSSQVTSVVQCVDGTTGPSAEYLVTVMARLVAPYMVRLTNGVMIPNPRQPGKLLQEPPEGVINDLLRLKRGRAGAGYRVGATMNSLW